MFWCAGIKNTAEIIKDLYSKIQTFEIHNFQVNIFLPIISEILVPLKHQCIKVMHQGS